MLALGAILSALTFGLWIAVCAAAPEFIWRGLRAAAEHVGWTDLFAALMIGLVLAFFVEPLMERVRDLLHRTGPAQRELHSRHNPLFTACLSLAFALVSVCLHHAITSFVHGAGEGEAPEGYAALAEGLMLASAWAFVPFVVTLAWLATGITSLAVPLGILAVLSPWIAGYLFDWSLQTMVSTAIPGVLILLSGYHHMLQAPRRHAVTRCARDVAGVAAAWLVFAVLFDAALPLLGLERYQLYTFDDFWIDARFYLGWTLGLILAPSPFTTRS